MGITSKKRRIAPEQCGDGMPCGLLAEGMVHLAIAAGQNLAVLVGAALVGDGAAGLAGALAGSLAFAAAAVLGTLAKIAGLNGVDVLHIANPPNFMSLTVIIARPQRTVNELTEENSPKR